MAPPPEGYAYATGGLSAQPQYSYQAAYAPTGAVYAPTGAAYSPTAYQSVPGQAYPTSAYALQQGQAAQAAGISGDGLQEPLYIRR